MKLLFSVLVLAVASTAGGQSADTLFADVGSPAIDARLFQPHAARVRIYRGDTLVAQWTNELSLGDSAGRRVMRWVTTGEPVPANPNRPLGVLRQTYDAVTLAPLGYSNVVNTGAFSHLKIDGRRVSGTRRTANDTTVHKVDVTLDQPGYFAGASDLIPVAAGLRVGSVIVAPVWNANAAAVDYRVFSVLRDTTLSIEGSSIVARKVEERRRSDRSLTAYWYLLTESPYMVYGEVPLPDGRLQRMTEVAIPTRR